MNETQVITFCSRQALYGVMGGQIAGLHRGPGEPGAGGAVDLVQFLEGPDSAGKLADQEFVITSHGGSRFRIPGPVELRVSHPDGFQRLPSLVSRLREDSAIRAAFAIGDQIGLLVDLDRVTVPS